jgi:hypothetical protein
MERTMAISESTPNPDNRNHLTRRAALRSTAATAAAVLPAAAAIAATKETSSGVFDQFVQTWKANPEMPRRFAGIASTGTDPHIGWWAELREVRASLDGDDMGEDDLLDRECEIENLIAVTAPTTPEGAAIVAAMIVAGHARVYPKGTAGVIEPEDAAGGTLARYFLAGLPPAVLQRAGLGIVA